MSEGFDIKNGSASKEYGMCHYCYFSDKEFNFQPDVCKGCRNALIKFLNLSDISILDINACDHPCIIDEINKNETMNLLQNANLMGKKT